MMISKIRFSNIFILFHIIVLLFIILNIFFFTEKAFATPSYENVGQNEVYDSGNVRINIYKNNQLFETSYITISNNDPPTFKNMRDQSSKWVLSSDGNIAVSNTTKTVMGGTWSNYFILSDDYPDGTFKSKDGNYYSYLFFDITFKLPRGYYYSSKSINSSVNSVANYIGLPQIAATPSGIDRMINGKYHLQVGATGIRTLNKIRYTGSEYNIFIVPNETNIVYDANGGYGEMENSKVIYGQESYLISNSFLRKGYIFSNWNTQKDGSGISFDDNESVSHSFATDKNVTLYAQWKKININLDKVSINMKCRERQKINATISPSEVMNQRITWESENEQIAYINEKGIVTAKKEGTTTIKAVTDDKECFAECKIHVKGFNENIDFEIISDNSPIHVNEKKTFFTNDETKEWKSSNPSIATVDKEGVVTAIIPGTVTITAVRNNTNMERGITLKSRSETSDSVTITIIPDEKYKTITIKWNGGRKKISIPKKYNTNNYKWKIIRYKKGVKVRRKKGKGTKKISLIIPKKKTAYGKTYNCIVKIYRKSDDVHIANYTITVKQKKHLKTHYRTRIKKIVKQCKKHKLFITAKCLKNSLNSRKKNIKFTNKSSVVKHIKKSPEYARVKLQIEKKLKKSNKKKVNNSKGELITFNNNMDLALAIHTCTYTWKAKKTKSKWLINFKIYDRYDFNDKTYGYNDPIFIINYYNNIAYKAYKAKAIYFYDINIRFDDKIKK